MDRCTAMLERQLAIDYGCSVQDVHGSENVFRLYRENPERRINGGEGAALRLAVYRDKLLVTADESIMPWCREELFHRRGTWFSEPGNLRALDDALRQRGHCIADAHHHYIPAENWPQAQRRFPVRWYHQEELETFRDDRRFGEALLFDGQRPDLMAVCAMEGETILGMAAVTRNSPCVWEIGVNVTESGRGKGVGSYVTALLKERVLSMGALPTYATVESHIASQRVAFQAGFLPAFYEIYTEKCLSI